MDILVLATSVYNDPLAEDWQPDLRMTIGYLRRNGVDADFRYEPMLSKHDVVHDCVKLAPQLLFVELSEETRKPVLEFLSSYKAANPRLLVAVGGIPATLQCNELLRSCANIDLIVTGERDETLLETARHIAERRPLDRILGLQSREFRNPLRPLIADLDSLGPMVHDGLAELLAAYSAHERVGYVSASRGCYANCSFCGIPTFFRRSQGAGWRGRSPENVVDELSSLNGEFGIRRFVFVDDNFIGPGEPGQKRARAIAHELIRRQCDIEYFVCCRLCDVHRNTFEVLRDSGLRGLGVSVESTFPASLSLLGKGLRAESIYPTLSLLEELEIRTEINLIFFDPYINMKGVRDNVALLEYVKNSEYLSYSDAFPFNELIAFPWSRVSAVLRRDGLLQDDQRWVFRDPQVSRLSSFVRDLRKHMHCSFKSRLLFQSDVFADTLPSQYRALTALSPLLAALRNVVGLNILLRCVRAACDVIESGSNTVDQELGALEDSFNVEMSSIREMGRGITEKAMQDQPSTGCP
jgi:radical SAM superfamily enzyme YgiQ (UPF0313 family)